MGVVLWGGTVGWYGGVVLGGGTKREKSHTRKTLKNLNLSSYYLHKDDAKPKSD